MDPREPDELCSQRTREELGTDVVYVCSPDFERHLFSSLRSLLKSGSSFDRVKIYCVGERPRHWIFVDPRIEVHEVLARPESGCLMEGRFLFNKTYLCDSTAERVIYLDADTLVREPIDSVWHGRDSDVIARTASYYHKPAWDHARWFETLRSIGGNDQSPYFNSGFLVFQNKAHRRLLEAWPAMIQRLAKGEPTCPDRLHKGGTRFAEQLALSLSISAERLSFHEMMSREHAFGWKGDRYEDSIVYHTGSGDFLKAVAAVAPSLDEGAPPLLQAG